MRRECVGDEKGKCPLFAVETFQQIQKRAVDIDSKVRIKLKILAMRM